jgi:dihydrofolate reductase
MKGIIAVNRKGYIGLNGKLPWHSSDDLLHFKSLTIGCKLLVGYNTANSLPVLKEREIFVCGRNMPIIDYTKIDWCIGGRKTYEKFCHLFDELHISHIDNAVEGDIEYPEFKSLRPECKIYHYYFK